ncbi:MAG: tyrosine-type recombinase/integrase [Clostridiaceae bacterium]|nr:tyrosine-type recombinase/integrase [Clostridiaceae bacterium]
MATAKKLPSGSWRCLAYSHTEKVLDPKTGKIINKRIYESFTSDDPTPQGKREAEAAAALFQVNKSKTLPKKRPEYGNMTLTEAIDRYIDSRSAIRSPTTIQDYRCIQKYAFQDIMQVKLNDLDEPTLIESVNLEAKRTSSRKSNNPKPISPKRLRNEWGLITAVLNTYRRDLDYNITLPETVERIPELIPAETILKIIKGTEIELAVLLAAWLSFSMSEIRGLTKSKSINGDYLTIREVVVTVDNAPYHKEVGKNSTRNRRHRIPPYIKSLIDKVDGDVLVPMNGHAIYNRWVRLLNKNNLPHMTFHDLRHLNASVMALLRVPDKYAQERGGWKSDKVMKRIYTQTFPDERIKVDNLIDNYFDSLIDTENKESSKLTPEEILELIQSNNTNGYFDEILNLMQHGMQHKNKEA